MTIKERVEVFITHQGIRRSAFEKACGFSNGYIRNLKENPSATKIEDILKTYPELNRVWLLSGEGEMLKTDNANNTSNATMVGGAFLAEQRDDDIVMVDFVPISASATFVESLSGDQEIDLDKYPIIPMGNERRDINSLRIFEVEGDSMSPTILSGSLILAKEIPERNWHYAEGVVVAVFSEYVVVKRIARNCLITDNYLILSSDNENYGTMTVALSDLRGLYKAKRIISSEIR